MRITPNIKYNNMPCSFVGTGSAYEDVYKTPFTAPLPMGLQTNGYLSLEDENKYIRKYLPVAKKVYYKRGERPLLKDFLKDNDKRCCICVYGHFIYVNGKDYWSFFNNENDDIVCIWYIKDDPYENKQQ